ncbi:MAG TPA: VOC family protein [Allosphingosinicella sp.]|jgi:catechol 2,3-dioxygenase-like lactoylglutathione lyase family enzyme
MQTTMERTTAIGAISPFFIVDNVGRSLAFYAALGFEPRFREPLDDPFFAIVGRDGAQIFLKHVGVEAQPNAGRHPWVAWDAFVHAHDPDALAEEFDHAGVPFHKPVGDRQDGLRGFEIRDPDGYILFFGRPR